MINIGIILLRFHDGSVTTSTAGVAVFFAVAVFLCFIWFLRGMFKAFASAPTQQYPMKIVDGEFAPPSPASDAVTKAYVDDNIYEDERR